MALSDVGLCARALVMIGAAPISSFGQDSAEAEVAAMLYPVIRDGMLAGYPWRFATRTAWLARISRQAVASATGTGTGAGGGIDAVGGASSGDGAGETLAAGQRLFALPGDFIRLLSLDEGGRAVREYELRENAVVCGADQAFLSYVGRLPEGRFPAWFDLALMTRLAAEFCLPLTESSSRADYLFKRADDLFAAARLADAQQATPRAIADFSLIDVRGG